VNFQPIFPIDGVSDELLRVLNDRFRSIVIESGMVTTVAKAPVVTPPPTGGGTGTSGVIAMTLTASSTMITAAAPAGDGEMLFVMLTQDATGGRHITWDTMFDLATPTGVDDRPFLRTVFNFVGVTGKWRMTSYPVSY